MDDLAELCRVCQLVNTDRVTERKVTILDKYVYYELHNSGE